MSECNKETLKLIANILGNVAAIAIGVALFDARLEGIAVAIIFSLFAIGTMRSLK